MSASTPLPWAGALSADRSARVAVDAHRLFRDQELSEELVGRLREFGRFAREELEPGAYEIDRGARPTLVPHDLGGQEVDPVRLASGHRSLLARLYAYGVVTGPFCGEHDLAFSFLLMHEVADVGLLCSATVTLATLFALEKYGTPELKARFGATLKADGALAQGATWATEAQGGSDLGANRTSARRVSDGQWTLRGEKYFCSNVGARFALVTGRPEGGAEGARGIRLFFAPARRDDGRPNWTVVRLKEKLGTVTVPTGEVVLDRAEAYLLGGDDEGVMPVMEMLNLSRVANAVGSAALAQRASEVARFHAERREAFGRRLEHHPLLAADLAELAVEADAASLLAFDAVYRFDRQGSERPPYSAEYHALRLATHAAKLMTAEQAVGATRLAMEVVGGPGYLEEFPVAKLVRDALVTPIWEGGANVQSLDAREVLGRHHPEAAWRADGETAVEGASEEVSAFLAERLRALAAPARDESSAKVLLRAWAEVRQATLLERRARLRPTPRTRAAAQLYARLHRHDPARGLPDDEVRAVLGP